MTQKSDFKWKIIENVCSDIEYVYSLNHNNDQYIINYYRRYNEFSLYVKQRSDTYNRFDEFWLYMEKTYNLEISYNLFSAKSLQDAQEKVEDFIVFIDRLDKLKVFL